MSEHSQSAQDSPSAQDIANAFFREYQILTMLNIDVALRDHQKWNSVPVKQLLLRPLAEQATFADYVVKNMCKQSSDIMEEFANDQFLRPYVFRDTSHVGAMALMCLTLPDGKTKEAVEAAYELSKEKTLNETMAGNDDDDVPPLEKV